MYFDDPFDPKGKKEAEYLLSMFNDMDSRKKEFPYGRDHRFSNNADKDKNTNNSDNNTTVSNNNEKEVAIFAIPALGVSIGSVSASTAGVLSGALRLLGRISLALIPLTFSGDTEKSQTHAAYIPPPQDLPGFPGAEKAKRKAGRERWHLPNGDIAEWDSQHGEVEVYDKTGKKHKGAYDPGTGDKKKDGDPKRKTEPK